MKQALLKFSSVKTPSGSFQKSATAGKHSRNCSLIDHLTASSTNTIIAEIIPLCCPDISYNLEQPLTFQQVINSIMKAIRHVHEVQRSSSVTDDERSTSSEGDEENLLSKRIRIKATHTVSGILLEAGEEISSAWSPHSDYGPSDEITVTPSSIRVHPTASKITKTLLKSLTKQPSSNQNWSELTISRNALLPVACKIYRSVQKNVFSFLLKVQMSTSTKLCEEPTERELQEVALGNGENLVLKLASEGTDVSLMNAVEVIDGRSSAWDEEQLCLEMCTDEVIRQILTMYRTQAQYLTSDLIESTCAQLVTDVLVKYVQILHAEKEKTRNMWRSISSHGPPRNLSCAVKTYLDSMAVEMTRSFLKDLQECVESGTETQTGFVSASIRSAFDHANIFTPFRLFRQVRNKIADISFTVNEDRWTDGSAGKDETVFEAVGKDGGSFSRGFARRQTETLNSSVNQLRSLLSRDSSTKHHEQAIANAISTVLRNITGTENLMRRFSESVLTEEPCCYSMVRASGFSILVLIFVLELVIRLACYFSNTGFLQLAVQTEFCKARATSDDEDDVTAALNELTRTLTDFVEECTATSATTPRTRKTKTQDEPNARHQESQITTSDDDVSCQSAQGSAGRKKMRKRRKITIHSRILKQVRKIVYFPHSHFKRFRLYLEQVTSWFTRLVLPDLQTVRQLLLPIKAPY
ncbi:hypothetical protein Baya_5766 [Bagarius yarrelli]|uniref:Uncharacterized protein n=1 Tax=Bagarius yarrelli TaxID=175774 RepID=A0A556TYH1_BAGYA|nr:hypothetical protein Baya_5766 [Bagarius yarrelli]